MMTTHAGLPMLALLQLGGNQLGHPLLIVRGVQAHGLILLSRTRLALAFDHPDNLPGDEPRVARP